MRRPVLRPLLAAAAAALVLAGLSCGKLTGTLRPHTPPETTLFVSGPVDTVNHVVHLYWYGSDPNGYVVGFEVRLLNPAAPAETNWVATVRTDSLLTVFTPQGYTQPVFEARAIDNDGARDPSPARQVFSFSNQPPVVRITGGPGPRDSTFASVTVTWSATDVDGDAAHMKFLVWLDGHAADPELTDQSVFTMPSDRFKSGGAYLGGRRTLYVRGIDDGGMSGPTDSISWYVMKPALSDRARLLIVDDVPRTNPANNLIDSLYSNTASRNLPPGTYTIVRLEFNQPFASAKDLEQTFRLFESVLWYRGNMSSVSAPLRDNQAGIGPYLENGGRMYLDGLYLFSGTNAPGALDEEFARKYLNCEGFLRTFAFVANFSDSTIGWGNTNGSVFRSTMFADSIRQPTLGVQPGEAGGLRVFKVRDPAIVALMAAPAILAPANAESAAVGVSVPQPSGGRMIVSTVPLGTSTPTNGSTAPRLLAKIFAQLGLTGP